MDFKLCSFRGSINKIISNYLQLIILGFHDCFQIYFCFCENETIQKINEFNKNAIFSHNIGHCYGLNIWNEADCNIYSFSFVWNCIFSNVWIVLCFAIRVRNGSNLLGRFKLFNVWSIGRGIYFNDGGLFDELVYSNNGILFSAILCYFTVLDLLNDNKYFDKR